jgi:hypothetical protein
MCAAAVVLLLFSPDCSPWRDMNVTSRNAAAATVFHKVQQPASADILCTETRVISVVTPTDL